MYKFKWLLENGQGKWFINAPKRELFSIFHFYPERRRRELLTFWGYELVKCSKILLSGHMSTMIVNISGRYHNCWIFIFKL